MNGVGLDMMHIWWHVILLFERLDATEWEKNTLHINKIHWNTEIWEKFANITMVCAVWLLSWIATPVSLMKMHFVRVFVCVCVCVSECSTYRLRFPQMIIRQNVKLYYFWHLCHCTFDWEFNLHVSPNNTLLSLKMLFMREAFSAILVTSQFPKHFKYLNFECKRK